MEEEYKLSTTKLIEYIYNENPEKIKDLINDIDFLEIVKYTRELNNKIYIVEELLSENIIKTLPLKMYKDLVSIEGWLYSFNNEKNSINSALFLKKFDFIELILDKLAEKINNNKKEGKHNYNSEDNLYGNYILERILLFPIRETLQQVGYTKKDIEKNFFSIWNKSLDLMMELDQYSFLKNNTKIKTYAEKIDCLKNNRLDSYLLAKEACNQKSLYVFFAKIMNDSNDELKLKFKELTTNSLLESSLFYNNKKVSDFLIKEKIYNTKTIINIFKNLNERIILNNDYSEKIKQEYLETFNACNNLLSTKEKKIIPAEYLLGITIINKENIEKFITEYPQIKEGKIIEDLTLNEVFLLDNISKIFSKNHSVEFHGLNKNIYYEKAKELFFLIKEEQNKKDFINSVIESYQGIKMVFKSDIIKSLGSKNTNKECMSIMNRELLDLSLMNNNNNKENKMKV